MNLERELNWPISLSYHLATSSVGKTRQIMVLKVQSTFEQRNSSNEGAHCNAVHITF